MSDPHLTNGTSEATIFSRIFESSQEGISPELARYILATRNLRNLTTTSPLVIFWPFGSPKPAGH